jgi:hypothetical protein
LGVIENVGKVVRENTKLKQSLGSYPQVFGRFEFTPRLLPWGRVRLPVKWRVGVIYANAIL